MTPMPAPYLDDAGKPLLRQSITGFIDVMGFSHLIDSAPDIEESQQLLEKIASAIGKARNAARRSFLLSNSAESNRWAVRFFSDNLVFGIPLVPEDLSMEQAAWGGIQCVQAYQLQMALSGFFVRGGLTSGPICLTDEIIFGSALLKCYHLESRASIVPRVILDRSLVRQIVEVDPITPDVPADVREWLCRDIDGWWFVNYLHTAVDPDGVDWTVIEEHKASVLASLAGVTRHDVLPKFGWACRYHNIFCYWHRHDAGYSDRYHIDRTDEQSVIYRMSEFGSEDLLRDL